MAEHQRRWRVLVRGDVQCVGYRAFTRRCASFLGLGGWVRNNPDGTVEAELVGPPERLAEMLDRLREGPRWSRVDGVDITREDEVPDPDKVACDFYLR